VFPAAKRPQNVRGSLHQLGHLDFPVHQDEELIA
jgi:hypothetical protein